jgi:hypothetical protein
VGFRYLRHLQKCMPVVGKLRQFPYVIHITDKATIESHADKYWKYCEDWSDSWVRLVDAGFIAKVISLDTIYWVNEVIFDSFMLDADEDYLPALQAGKLRRYLYIVTVPDDFESAMVS